MRGGNAALLGNVGRRHRLDSALVLRERRARGIERGIRVATRVSREARKTVRIALRRT